MLEHLFGSKTRYKLLRLFFRSPEKSYYVRELSRFLGTQINAVRRELELLLKSGLIKEIEDKGKKGFEAGASLRRYYMLDTEALIYPELQALLSKAQLAGEQEFIKSIQNKGGEIKFFLLSGQFTGDHAAPSDILLVGNNLKERNIANIIADYEKEIGTEVRYTTMSDKEFMDRRQMMDKFLYSLFECENVKVVNKFNV